MRIFATIFSVLIQIAKCNYIPPQIGQALYPQSDPVASPRDVIFRHCAFDCISIENLQIGPAIGRIFMYSHRSDKPGYVVEHFVSPAIFGPRLRITLVI